MDFPDQSHINRVRDALWCPHAGRASIMVGSGFSQNATVRVPGASLPPDWSGVVRAMHSKLYPAQREPDSDGASRPVIAADALAIAQQYRIAFGREELHRFLRQQVRDEDITPGDFHRRLLSLPWNDVFTTNWDTLLERTRDHIASPRYEVVREVDEIPLASRPRIVKLHGSMPANFPLIVTEEDYRGYTTRFAPLVNTAQQAMMETVFLLIGFSGRDPNFLHWSGWVRDQLGSSAPQIYAAGWLDLSVHERRVLESRNVVPIDLAHHPKGVTWDKQNRHRLATDWILRTLELGKPYPVEEWPKVFARPHGPAPEQLQPLDETPWVAPSVETQFPTDLHDSEAAETITRQISTWAHNRALYPGWLSVPARRLVQLALTTKRWEEPMLEFVQQIEPQQRLNAIYEMVWRHEVVLDPLGPELAHAAKEALRETIDHGLGTDDTAAVAARLAVALVTHARTRLDKQEFEQAAASASMFADHDPEVANRIQHEECLWSLYDLDFEGLRTALDAWTPGPGDPFWTARKVALMIELGCEEAVVPLLKSTINALRHARADSRNIHLLSRESWAFYLLNALENGLGDDADESYHSTMRELRRFNCDPEGDIQHLARALQQTDHTERGPAFELGERRLTRPTIRFRGHDVSGPEALRINAAYRAVRLGEVAALPPSAGYWSITTHILANAAEVLHADGQENLALRLMLRITTYDGDDLLKRLLSRPKLASMPQHLAETLANLCLRVIEYYVERGFRVSVRQGAVHPVERIRVSMESLSRFALRLTPEEVADIFAKALRYYGNTAIASHLLLQDAVRNLLHRTWEALPAVQRTRFVFDVLNAPIVGVDGFTAEPFRLVDPGDLIEHHDSPLPDRNDATQTQWQQTVRFLLHSLTFDKESRSRAMLRLVKVTMASRLDETEMAAVARTIWDPEAKARYDLPAADSLRHWVYLAMPEVERGSAERWFRDTWISDEHVLAVDDELAPENALFHVGDAKQRAQDEAFTLDFSPSDEAYITRLLRKWADTPLPRALLFPLPILDQQRAMSLRNAIHGATALLMHVDVPSEVVDALYLKHQKLFDAGVFAMSLLVGLRRLASHEEASEIAITFRKGLASENESLVFDTAHALQAWLYFAQRDMVDSPPNDLIREIGFTIATRRSGAIAPALWLARWIYEHGRRREQEALHQLTIEGLGFLIHQLDYSNTDFEDVETVPDLRWKCVAIARAMHDRGYEDPIIQDWLMVAREDPLPEVRQRVSDIAI